MGTKYILYFNEIDKKDLPLVGGKGANLGEMTKAGFPVPYGFCVTTESYKEFINCNNLSEFIIDEIKDANLENIEVVGEKIRKKINASEIPENIVKEIINIINHIGIDDYYAIRSSATAEDLAFASFAGQQDTYLNINGEENIINSIRSCFASLFTDRAILYRLQNKIEHEKVHMSVVIQKMVFPDISGIMFTADPVSGHRGIVSIDASYGLGEALVSGLVSPDIYKVNKKKHEIEDKNIANKKLAIMPLKGGGTEKVEIKGEKATTQVLKDSYILGIAELGAKIENHYACPQDIEWCLEKDKLYIVQSRAITSLFPLPKVYKKDKNNHVYISINHLQVMTDSMTPLGLDMFRNILPIGRKKKGEERYSLLPSAGGRIYADATKLLYIKKVRKNITKVLSNADGIMAKSLDELLLREDFNTRFKENKPNIKPWLKFITPVLFKAAKNMLFGNLENTVDFMNNYLETRKKTTEEAVFNAKQGVERLDVILEEGSIYRDMKIIFPKIAPGILSFKALEHLEKKLLGSNKYTNTISKGLSGNASTEMGLLIGDLADEIRKSKALYNEFKNEDYKSLITRINNLKDNNEFKERFNSFINEYGVRASGEIDIGKDRWIENPEALVKSILSIIETSKEGLHRKEYKETIEKATEAANNMIKEVEEKHGKLKAKVVKRLIYVLRNSLPAREHHKLMMVSILMIFKKAFLEDGKLLVEKGSLVNEKDIFYLSFWELYNAVAENKDFKGIVEKRKEEYEHYSKLTPPRVMTSDGEEIKISYKVEDLPKGAIPGIPVSSGVIEGIAKVITDPNKGTLNKGEILIAPFTDPGWTPFFINASGLVMEVGGLLTHGTVVAREYGIPAVVGIDGATKKIKTGQRIRVDGDSGYVMIIEE